MLGLRSKNSSSTEQRVRFLVIGFYICGGNAFRHFIRKSMAAKTGHWRSPYLGCAFRRLSGTQFMITDRKDIV